MKNGSARIAATIPERKALVVLANAGLIHHEWSVKCYDCPRQWSMDCGGMKITAINRADFHARKRIGHTVYILDYQLHVSKHVYEPPEESKQWGR